ncbi:unnamed protein product [Wuchereria bancrofti]|uniref:Sushi domain-containing protein n=1 Tax=Wuchereria bancrofti TaxID=6293 RepID=A0A3P7DMG6_WUCBA|nr:unnamed protein product [Wuchereria bancrofti]
MGEGCNFFHYKIAPCSPPKLAIPYIAYNPFLSLNNQTSHFEELINLNALKYPHGTIAMLICPPNHYLEVEGSRWRVCVNGTWSGSFGRCKQLGT